MADAYKIKVIDEPTVFLRWNNGVLEQKHKVTEITKKAPSETYSPSSYKFKEDWRPIEWVGTSS